MKTVPLLIYILYQLSLIRASWTAFPYDRFASFNYVNQEEGYSCYENFVNEMTTLLEAVPMASSTFPRFVSLLRSINRRQSYYRTPEYDYLEKCRPPIPLQEDDFERLVDLVRSQVSGEDGDIFVDALKYHFDWSSSQIYQKYNKSISNLIAKDDVEEWLRLIKRPMDVLYILHILNTSGKQRVAVKLTFEDRAVAMFPEIVKYITKNDQFSSKMIYRLSLSNRPFLPTKGSLKWSVDALSGRHIKCADSSGGRSSNSSSSNDDNLSASDCEDNTSATPSQSPNNPNNSSPLIDIPVDKKRCYLRKAFSPFFVSIGSISDRTTLFSHLLSMRNADPVEQVHDWAQAISSNPALFAYLQTDQRVTVFRSDYNSACWLLRNNVIIESTVLSSELRHVWTVQRQDILVGIAGYNNIKLFDPMPVVASGADLKALKAHLEDAFPHQSQYSAAFIATVDFFNLI